MALRLLERLFESKFEKRFLLLKRLFKGLIFAITLGLSLLGLSSLSNAEMQQGLPKVQLETELGNIVIELFPQAAPITVDNFLKYVDDYYYDGTIFHRVISGFMIQGGGYGFDLSMKQTNRAPIVNESNNGLNNVRGTIAMARTSDPDSATSQFFINHKSNPSLNNKKNRPGYAVFGQVIEGIEVIDKIAAVETSRQGYHGNVPVEPVLILKARLLNPDSWTPLPETTNKLDYEAPIPVR